ncbi:MAG TPA: SH3 domain-containing protein [Terriglobales bacterium]|nr:SH3 domain-containing protein [Terriglobales bacterium]
MARTDAAGCPADERLLSHLLGEAGGDEEIAVHLQVCDRCVAELMRAQRRLALAEEIAVPVPAAVLERCQAPTLSPAPAPLRRPSQRAALWVPLALAAGAVLALATLRDTPPGAAPQTELTRDVQLRQDARITSASATLRQAPQSDATVLRDLARGDRVVLFDRDQDWYQVALPDGTKGWIEAASFE